MRPPSTRLAALVAALATFGPLAAQDPLDRRPARKAAPAPEPVKPDDDPVAAAIKKGAEYLKGIHKPGQGAPGGLGGYPVGSAALGGLALLESGVPPDDPVVQHIASSIRQHAMTTTDTYQCSLAVMFLDRLGKKTDEPLIQFMGLRVLSGQAPDGTWSYGCGLVLPENELQNLQGLLVKDVKLVAGPRTPKVERPPPKKEEVIPIQDLLPEEFAPPRPKPEPKKPEARPAAKRDALTPPTRGALHPEMAKLWGRMQNAGPGGPSPLMVGGGGGDHSNTQFATMALWSARRHGVPVDRALERLDRHYRSCQNPDGGWGYSKGSGTWQSMTCNGLMGLAVAYGGRADLHTGAAVPADGPAPKGGGGKDAVILNGLKYLGAYLAGEAARIQDAPRGNNLFPTEPRNPYLFLWSVERVAVVYGLNKVGDVDWHGWGSEILVSTQLPDGSWPAVGSMGTEPPLATAFSVLFLCRANLAKDLSTAMKGKFNDNDTASLRGGAGNVRDYLGGGARAPAGRPPAAVRDPATTRPPARRDPTTDVTLPTVKPSPTGGAVEADRLAGELVDAAAAQRGAVLSKLRDSKGVVHTEALLRAIPRLDADALAGARDALANRLTRMTAATLRDMMKDPERELRRAACLAAAGKGDRSLTADVRAALGDKDPAVARAARAALTSLTGKDR